VVSAFPRDRLECTRLTTEEPALDARWSEKGAICVMQPRMQISSHPDWHDEFQNPDALTRIRQECPQLPFCENDDPHDLAGARIINVNRIPVP
jgi:hypothetical protein